MEILSINLEKGCGIRKEVATGVRILAGKRFLEEVIISHDKSLSYLEPDGYTDVDPQFAAAICNGYLEAQEIANAHISEIRYNFVSSGYSIDLSYKAASYLLESIGHHARVWKGKGFKYAPMVRSALALERHLDKYGLPPQKPILPRVLHDNEDE